MDHVQPNALSLETGAMLRAARKSKGLTLEQAADRIGLNFSYLSQLERGNKAPSKALAVDIIHGLQLNRDQSQALMAESVSGVGRDRRSKRVKAAAKASAN